MPVDFPALHRMEPEALRERARTAEVEGADRLRRHDLIYEIGRAEGARSSTLFGRGVLEVHGEGFGFLRSPHANFLPGPDDIYVSQSQIRRFKLQTGDTVIGVVRPPKEGERYLALLRVETINGEAPGEEPPSFDTLTAIYPDDRLDLRRSAALRAVDLAAPMGLGQRALLAAPTRTGGSDLLRGLADAIAADEELLVTVLLIGERPEEIGEWRAHCAAEVVATPFYEPASRHVQVADIVFERARRLVERGEDVVILVDSLSRLLRFHLADQAPSGRTISSLDANALQQVQRHLGAARAFEEGGSLTVIGLVQADEDNATDMALLSELRGVVNWELTLSTEVADRGIRPPIDVHRSGTLRAERLITDNDERVVRARLRASFLGQAASDARALLEAAGATPVGEVAENSESTPAA